LKVQEAGIQIQVANFEKLVAQTQAQAASDQQVTAEGNEKAETSALLQQALATLQTQAADFQQQALELIMQAQATSQPQVIVMNPPKEKTIQLQRVNGQMQGKVIETPTADDQQVVSQAANSAAQALQQHAQNLAEQMKPVETTRSVETVRTADGFDAVITDTDAQGNIVKQKRAKGKRGKNGISAVIQ
jgi:hypothetical protein